MLLSVVRSIIKDVVVDDACIDAVFVSQPLFMVVDLLL